MVVTRLAGMTSVMSSPMACGGVIGVQQPDLFAWFKNVEVSALTLPEGRRPKVPIATLYRNKLSPKEKFQRAAWGIVFFAKGTKKAGPLARMLVTSHWLEAIDPKHRYGSLLKKYFKLWLGENTDQDFFYWLDYGGGRGVGICSISKGSVEARADLEMSQVKYCNAAERKQFATKVVGRQLQYQINGQAVHTPDGTWIFVLAPDGTLYVAQKKRGYFHHSSFLAGGPTLAAGRIKVIQGVITSLEAHSGHYRPEKAHFKILQKYLSELGLDLSNVEIDWSILEHNKRKAT